MTTRFQGPEQGFSQLFPFVTGGRRGPHAIMRAVLELQDEELVARFQAEEDTGRRNHYAEELFRRHQPRVVLWCLRLAGNRESAADLAQEVFLKAYRGLATFRGEARFSTWLYSITRHHFFNQLKARQAEPEETEGLEDLPLPDTRAENVESTLVRESQLAQMRQMMRESLTELESRVMTLHFGEELPLSAIGRMLGLENPSGAKAYIVSAKRKLADAIRRRQGRDASAKRQQTRP